MIIVRNDEEIDKLREAGRIVGLTHKYSQQFIKPGITTKEHVHPLLKINFFARRASSFVVIPGLINCCEYL